MDLKQLKAETVAGICVPEFMAASFTISKKWKQPKFPLSDEWKNKTHTHIHTVKHYSALKMKEI